MSFAISTGAKELRVLATVAPTIYKDRRVTAVVGVGGEAMTRSE
ncbi:MAG: hypothetical protein OXI64_08770 [Defluviicoccus sp.]|nr:hypothetical protein [Defluviicoccus sp.]